MANKSLKRVEFIKDIANSISDPEIYSTIKYDKLKEVAIRQFLYSYIVNSVAKQYHKDKKCKLEYALNKAKDMVLWESNKKTTIHNVKFMGKGNRPDFVIEYPKMSIAIEVKRGINGSSIREAIGQSMAYRSKFDFVICLVIDISKNKEVVKSINEEAERKTVDMLWSNNIYFLVV